MLKWVDETKSRRRSFYGGDLDSISMNSTMSTCSYGINDSPNLVLTEPEGRPVRPENSPVSPEQIVIQWKRPTMSPDRRAVDRIKSATAGTSTVNQNSTFINPSGHVLPRIACNTHFKQRSLSQYDGNQTTDQVFSAGLKVSTAIPTSNQDKNKIMTFWKKLKIRRRSKEQKSLMKKSQSIADIVRSESTLSMAGSSSGSEPSVVPPSEEHSRFIRSVSPTNSIAQRHSLKNIRKHLESRKPKLFSHNSNKESESKSADSVTLPKHQGLSSSNLQPSRTPARQTGLTNTSSLGTSDEGSDSSPELSLKLGLGSLEQEFTEAVLRILSMRDDSISDISDSEETTGDVFCYNTDTIVRRQNNSKAKALSH